MVPSGPLGTIQGATGDHSGGHWGLFRGPLGTIQGPLGTIQGATGDHSGGHWGPFRGPLGTIQTKYTKTFGQIHKNIWTNTQEHLDKYTNTFGQIHENRLTNTHKHATNSSLSEITGSYFGKLKLCAISCFWACQNPFKPLYLINFKRFY